MAVGLGQHERNAREHRGQPDGPGHVAAAAEDRRRPELADDPPRVPHRAGRDQRRPGRRDRAPARQRRDAERAQLVAGGRDELELGAVAADERDLGALSSQRVGHRQRRHDVPGGPAGADHDPSALSTFGVRTTCSRRPGRAMLSSRPTPASITHRFVGA